MMQKIFAVITLTICAVFSSGAAIDNDAQEAPVADAAQAFVRLPASCLKLLDRNTRLDMIDFYAADSIWTAKNAMQGYSRLDTVAQDYLKVRITDVSTCQIRLLPLKKGGNLVAAVYTINSGDGAPDSQLFFFDDNLRPLEQKKFFSQPTLKQLLTIPRADKKESKRLEALIPFPTIEFFLSPADNNLRGELTIGKYMTREDYATVEPYLTRRLEYLWDGSRFRPATGK